MYSTSDTKNRAERGRANRIAVLPVVAAICATTGLPLASAQCPNPSWNGYCPETTPRPGEVPIWQSQFKSARNSIDRSESQISQVDDYNNWMLEFNLYLWVNATDTFVMTVDRDVCEFSVSPINFAVPLAGIDLTATARQRVTFIYMKPGGGGSYPYECYRDFDNFPNSAGSNFVKEYLTLVLPEEEFYTHADFRDIDNFVWPSPQELVRRGKYFVPILAPFADNNEGPVGVEENFFFGVFDGNPDWSNPGNRVLAQRDGGCDGGGTPSSWTPNSRFLMRGYPNGACAGTCGLQNGGYWDDGVSQGFNFISTDCVDDDLCVDPGIHSPMPYFVSPTGTPNNQWGTLAFPKVGPFGLWQAVQVVSPMVEVQMLVGDYPVTAMPSPLPGGPLTINRPMVLVKRPGAGDVVIR